MKDLVRLLMVAVLSFAVVGAALVYSRDSDTLDDLAALFIPGGTKPAAARDPAPVAGEQPALTRLWIARPAQDEWMGLAGFPDHYDVSFPIPSGIGLVGGTLELDIESELAEHGDGRMTIIVNGKRRGEIVLNTGRETHKLALALEADDLLGSQVVLELAGRGTTNSGQICPTDAANSGAAVTLLASSGLALYTNDPVDRPDIRLAALAEPMSLALGTDPAAQAQAIWAAQKMGRAGLGLRLAGAGDSADMIMGPGGQPLALDAANRLVVGGAAGVERVIAQRNPSLAAGGQWPVTAEMLGAETLAKNFRGSRRWTLPYAIADLPGGLMPRQFSLDLKTSTLTGDNEWVVRVSLNGNLLTSERFPGSSDRLSLVVELPTAMQGLSNAVLVELIDTTPNDSICRAGPDAQAQLLPSSAFVATGGQPAKGWGEMVRTLARAEAIGLDTGKALSIPEAQRARALLSSFLPADASMAFGEAVADAGIVLTVVPVGQLMASLDVASRLAGGTLDDGASLYFAVGGIGSAATEPTLLDLADPESRAWLGAHSPNDVGILIAR